MTDPERRRRPTPYPHPRKGDRYLSPSGIVWVIETAWRMPGSKTHQVDTVDVVSDPGGARMKTVPRKEWWAWKLLEDGDDHADNEEGRGE